ncbi:MAG: hypothetical protein AAF160_20810 [Pseudomonadota bacterium]
MTRPTPTRPLKLYLDRRTFALSITASTLCLASPARAADSALALAGEEIPAGAATLADCAVIGSGLSQINGKIAEVAIMTDTELFAELQRVEAALAETGSKHEVAAKALDAAIAANASELKEKSIEAVRKGNDLMLATAVQTRNVHLVGAAVGTHVLVGTGVFAVQAMRAETQGEQIYAAAVLAEDRMAMVGIFRTGPGTELLRKQVELSFDLLQIGNEVNNLAGDGAALREQLRQAKAALAAIRADQGLLPGTAEDTRAYLTHQLEAERFVYDLLATTYSSTLCRVPDHTPIPVPSLG